MAYLSLSHSGSPCPIPALSEQVMASLSHPCSYLPFFCPLHPLPAPANPADDEKENREKRDPAGWGHGHQAVKSEEVKGPVLVTKSTSTC